MGGNGVNSPQYYYRSRFGDTTLTKVFVGGLAWETQTEELRQYFEKFGEILEAVIITERNTGRSKGYGFVTFRYPESARRSVADPNPLIDGRRANCNIAALGCRRHSTQRVQMSSFSTSTSRALTGRKIYCRCNMLCVIFKVRHGDNEGRKFYRCPRNRSVDDCNYFKWLDESDDVDVEGSYHNGMVIEEMVRADRANFDTLKKMLKIVIILLLVILFKLLF